MSDLTVYKSLAWQRLLTVTKESDGSRRNLTGATVLVDVKRNYTDVANAFQLSVGNGVTLLTQSGATEGQATVDISQTIRDTLNLENYVVRVSVQPSGDPAAQVVIDWRKLQVRP